MHNSSTTSPPDSQLRLQQIRIALGSTTLVNLDCTIAGGEIFTVMGPSGSGKSSLLAYLGGFLAPAFTASGKVQINDRDVTKLPPEERRLGLLFQDPLLFPHLSVAGNLHFGLPASATDKKARVSAALAQTGLADFADRDPATLSGGQKSRVALLRLLLSEPQAVLLDEPFSKLDTQLRREIREQVFLGIRQAKLPAILVTHDEADAEAAGGQVLRL